MPVSVSDDAADAGNEPGLRPLAGDEWGDEEYAAYGSMLRMPGDRVPRFGSGHAYDPERFSVVGTFVRHPALAKAFWGFNGYQLNAARCHCAGGSWRSCASRTTGGRPTSGAST